MTPEGHELDPGPFLSQESIILYRLARARYATFSGAGSALYPGRWNRPGQEAIYTSLEVGTAGLEVLVHLSKKMIPSNWAIMKLRLRLPKTRMGQFLVEGSVSSQEPPLASVQVLPSLSTAKKEFKPGGLTETGRPFAVALPSAIVPAWNVVLFPDNPGFWDFVTLDSIHPFEFDPRLFTEDAHVEG